MSKLSKSIVGCCISLSFSVFDSLVICCSWNCCWSWSNWNWSLGQPRFVLFGALFAPKIASVSLSRFICVVLCQLIWHSKIAQNQVKFGQIGCLNMHPSELWAAWVCCQNSQIQMCDQICEFVFVLISNMVWWEFENVPFYCVLCVLKRSHALLLISRDFLENDSLEPS